MIRLSPFETKCTKCRDYMDRLLKDQNDQLKKENEQLKKQVADCMKDMSVMTDINPKIYYKKMEYIKVLEKALCNTCYLLYGTNDEHYPNWFKKQAKKELGDKE